MITLNLRKSTAAILLVLSCLSPASAETKKIGETLAADAEKTKGEKPSAAELLAAPSDATSLKLLGNYLTAIGVESHTPQITASGTFTYGSETKSFELIETAEGARALNLKWSFLGRPYTETVVSIPPNYREGSEEMPNLWRIITKAVPDRNGKITEERVYLFLARGKYVLHEEAFGHTTVSYNQRLRGRRLTDEQRRVLGGSFGERSRLHFQTVPLFLHEFFNFEVTGCRYIGTDKVGSRSTYAIRRGADFYYYIDQKNFLLLKWGRDDSFGGQKMEIAYVANSFKRWDKTSDAILFPAKITITAKGESLGSYTVDRVQVDEGIDWHKFTPPEI